MHGKGAGQHGDGPGSFSPAFECLQQRFSTRRPPEGGLFNWFAAC